MKHLESECELCGMRMNALPASVGSWNNTKFLITKNADQRIRDQQLHTSIACTSDGSHDARQNRNQQLQEVALRLPVLHLSALATSSIHPGNAGNGLRCSFGLSVAFAKVKPRIRPCDRYLDFSFPGSRSAARRVITHTVLLA